MSGQLALIIKATRLCNLRCSYCHDWRSGPNQTMSFEVLATMVAKALQDPVHRAVEFIWHGGETTILNPKFYEKALLVQAQFRQKEQFIQNSIQTNCTLITPAWAKFFREFKFHVSISLDGPPEIHDTYRVGRSGEPTFAKVLKGIETLREYDIPISVLMVIDEKALQTGPDRIFDFFLEHGITSYGLLAAKPLNLPDAPPNSPADHYVEPHRMTAFLMQLYDRWEKHGDSNIRIRELSAIEKRLRGGRADCCTLAGNCFGKYYLVEPNGDVAHCDLFLGDSRYTIGNLLRNDFSEFRQSSTLAGLRAENSEKLMQMQSCPEFAVCNGWCPHERYISGRHNQQHSTGCCGLHDLIQHVRKRLDARSKVCSGIVQEAANQTVSP